MFLFFFYIFGLQPPLDDHLADIVDDEWRQDQLPHEQVYVPSEKLPDPEADNGDSHLTLLEQVNFLHYHIRSRSLNFECFYLYRNSVGLICH